MLIHSLPNRISKSSKSIETIQHNMIQLYCQVSRLLHKECVMVPTIMIQHNITLMPSVNVTAQRMCYGAKCQGYCTKNVSWFQPQYNFNAKVSRTVSWFQPQYNFNAKCQGYCTRNVSWFQPHSRPHFLAPSSKLPEIVTPLKGHCLPLHSCPLTTQRPLKFWVLMRL